MTYLVNEVFLTVQGEGFWSGRPAVFCRFAKCNLWTGREEDRATATCKFCDTDFGHGERLTRDELVSRIHSAWPGNGDPMVVFTGGEPAIQLDTELIEAVGFYSAIETNGTMPLPSGLDWVCVSPKANTTTIVTEGDEVKVVWPQNISLDDIILRMKFQHYWLSPMDGTNLADNTAATVDYVLANPYWRLNTQTHKQIGVR